MFDTYQIYSVFLLCLVFMPIPILCWYQSIMNSRYMHEIKTQLIIQSIK